MSAVDIESDEYKKQFLHEATKLAIESVEKGWGGPFGAVIVKDGEREVKNHGTLLRSEWPFEPKIHLRFVRSTIMKALAILVLGISFAEAANFSWQKSLVFDGGNTSPQPTQMLNIVAHKGKLFSGASTLADGGFGNHQSYIFRKDSPTSPWVLDATFPRGTLRVDALASVTFINDALGHPILGGHGPITLLMASTNKGGSDLLPVRVFVRNDDTGTWTETHASTQTNNTYDARQILGYRDSVTKADMVFVAAGDAPMGIYSGTYDATKPGGIRWNIGPEIAANSNTGSQKWFGMDIANGQLFASNRSGVFKRNDGPNPTWTKVSSNETSGFNPELRGLTGVPSIEWPEPEMLIFSWKNSIWRMRAAPPYTQVKEIDLGATVEAFFGLSNKLVEAAFNTILKYGLSYPIAFSFDFGDPSVPKYTDVGDPYNPGDVTGKRILSSRAFYIERDVKGTYSSPKEIVDPSDPDKVTILARDMAASPFSGELNVVYAAGMHAIPASGNPTKGTAWVYKGTDNALGDTIPPVISAIATTNITTSSATITWTTDELATSRVNYGKNTALKSNKNDNSLVTSHSVTLTNLFRRTTYIFKVSSIDAVGNKAESSNQTFTTAKRR